MTVIENQFSLGLFYYFLKANWYIATISVYYLVHHRPDFRSTIVLLYFTLPVLIQGLCEEISKLQERADRTVIYSKRLRQARRHTTSHSATTRSKLRVLSLMRKRHLTMGFLIFLDRNNLWWIEEALGKVNKENY